MERVHVIRNSAGLAVLLFLGCETGSSPLSPDLPAPGGTGAPVVSEALVKPQFAPGNFVSVIDNPFYPLTPGTVFHFRSETPDGIETNPVRVTRRTKQILGVTTTVVHDRVFLDGELTEDTFDWFAQDAQGNVWYFGEDSKELENGKVVSTEGSWQAGVNGAEPGVVMLAHPKTGLTYRQEFSAGVAEDIAKVLGLKASVDVPYGHFDGCIQTLEYTPLELGVREHKFYCRGIGVVLEVQPKEGRIKSELVRITHF
jgi:hypothetical protein